MFGWLKRLIGGRQDTPPPREQRTEAVKPATAVSVMTVVDRFLTANTQRTPHGVHALIAAGVTDLQDPADVQRVCAKIEEHGYQFPLNPTLRRELNSSAWLDYLRWHAGHGITKEEYERGDRILELLRRYREER